MIRYYCHQISLFVIIAIVIVLFISQGAEAGTTSLLPRKIEDETFLQYMRRSVRKYGGVKIQEAFDSLDNKNISEVLQLLVGQVDSELVADILAMHQYADSFDPKLMTVLSRVNKLDYTVATEVLAIDGRLTKFPWWKRLRGRILKNVEQFICTHMR